MDSVAPKVSVVMIAYNKQDYIAEAVAGVVNQKCGFDIELIVMDDCSTDDTPAIVAQWVRCYPRIIRYFRNEKNLGLQGNYIEGFKHCRGEYLAICDADDYWFYRRKLQVMCDYMDAHRNCAIAFHRVINFYEATGEKSLSNGGMVSNPTVESLSRSNFITNLSVVYRRGLVDLTKLPEWVKNDRSPDYALHMLYAAHGDIKYFSRPMGVYRKASGSAWSVSDRYVQLRMSLSVRLHLLDEFRGNDKVCTGLRESVKRILEAMKGLELPASRMNEIEETAEKLSMELSCNPQTAEAPERRLVSRIRGAVSRFVPLPKP